MALQGKFKIYTPICHYKCSHLPTFILPNMLNYQVSKFYLDDGCQISCCFN